MKVKIVIVMFLFSFSFLDLYAQENGLSTKIFKQESGDKSLEVNFDPGSIFGSNSGNQFGLFDGGIKYRLFKTENTAFRIGVNVSFYNYVDILQTEDEENNIPELKSSRNNFSINLRPGYEKHFGSSRRLSPYIGFQGLLGYTTRSYMVERQDSPDNINELKWVNDPAVSGQGSVNLGAGVFAGIDFYFVEKLYLGIEIGYGFQYSRYLKTTYSDKNQPDNNYEKKNGHYIGVAPSLATGNLRLGWTF